MFAAESQINPCLTYCMVSRRAAHLGFHFGLTAKKRIVSEYLVHPRHLWRLSLGG